MSRYQKSKTNLDFTEARDSEWQWHQLGHMQVCTSLHTDNHTSTPPLSFFTGRMPFQLPNQQCQSTEGHTKVTVTLYNSKLQYRERHLPQKMVDKEEAELDELQTFTSVPAMPNFDTITPYKLAL